jgi:hypothetical protein
MIEALESEQVSSDYFDTRAIQIQKSMGGMEELGILSQSQYNVIQSCWRRYRVGAY